MNRRKNLKLFSATSPPTLIWTCQFLVTSVELLGIKVTMGKSGRVSWRTCLRFGNDGICQVSRWNKFDTTWVGRRAGKQRRPWCRSVPSLVAEARLRRRFRPCPRQSKVLHKGLRPRRKYQKRGQRIADRSHHHEGFGFASHLYSEA